MLEGRSLQKERSKNAGKWLYCLENKIELIY